MSLNYHGCNKNKQGFRKNFRFYAKELLRKMWIIYESIRKVSLYGSVKDFLYNKFIDSYHWFIFLHSILFFAHVKTVIFLVFMLSHALFRLHFHSKGKTSKLPLVATRFHFEFLTIFGTLDYMQSKYIHRFHFCGKTVR